MSAQKLIDHLERQGWLEANVIEDLRKQVADSRFAITPDAVIKLLVDKGHLTPFQARKLADQVGSDDKGQPAARAKSAPAAPSDDDLGLVPFEEAEASGSIKRGPAPKPTPPPPEPKPESKPSKSSRKPESANKPSSSKKHRAPKETVELEAAPELIEVGGLQELTPLDGGLMPLDMAGGAGGLMGDLTGMSPGGPLTPSGGEGTESKAPAASPSLKKKRARHWNNSPLIIIGIPALALIIFAGVILYFYLTAGRASEVLDQAEQDYKAESYGNAIKKYEKYLKDFPSDEKVSYARVRRGLARMRLAVQGATDMRLALDTALEVLPEIEKEPKFPDNRDEVAAILPTIAAGFAKQAQSIGVGPKAEELVKLAEQAMELVNNPTYIPTSLRQAKQATIDAINRNIALAKRSIQQDKELHLAVAAIQAAAGAGKTVEAFEIRRTLLQNFPGLETHPELVAVVLQVAERERDLVKIMEEAREAVATDPPPATKVLRCVMSHRIGGSVDGADNHVAFVLAKGAVYGLDAATGQLLWRRFVGHETTIHPLSISKTPGADALVVDSRQNELLRLQAKTGNLVWRLPIGERFFAPSVVDSRALISMESGRLLEVDMESGKSTRAVRVPLPLSSPAGASARWPNAYQVGTHSNAYVLDASTLICKEVFYLGHKAGTVTMAPVMSLNLLFIVENAGTDYSLLHVMSTDAKGLGLKRIVEPFRLNGTVSVPILQVKNRVIVLTNFGEAKVFEVAQTDTETTVKLAATLIATTKTAQPGFTLVDGPSLFIGGERLAGYDIQTTREQLNRKWAQNEQETFVAPLQRFGNALVHVRRRRGSPGITVSAVLTETGTQVWRTDLAVPVTYMAGDVDRKQIVAITEHGDLFRLTNDVQRAGLIDKPVESAEVPGSEFAFAFQDSSILSDGRVVASNYRDRSQLVLFDPRRDSGTLGTLKLDTGDRKPELPPLAYGAGLLVSLESGQIVLMSADTGKAISLPYQPRLEPGAKINWLPPSFTGPEQREFVISDGARKFYRIGLKEQPQSHLAPLAEADLNAEFVRPPAVAGDTAYGIVHGPTGDTIQSFVLPNLTRGKELSIEGRVVQGPWQVGGTALLVSDKEGLVCLEGGQNQRWTLPLKHGPLCGKPALDNNTLWLASTTGYVWRVALDTGAELGGVALNDPLSSGPVLYGNAVVAATSDGTLVVVRASSAETEATARVP